MYEDHILQQLPLALRLQVKRRRLMLGVSPSSLGWGRLFYYAPEESTVYVEYRALEEGSYDV